MSLPRLSWRVLALACFTPLVGAQYGAFFLAVDDQEGGGVGAVAVDPDLLDGDLGGAADAGGELGELYLLMNRALVLNGLFRPAADRAADPNASGGATSAP